MITILHCINKKLFYIHILKRIYKKNIKKIYNMKLKSDPYKNEQIQIMNQIITPVFIKMGY